MLKKLGFDINNQVDFCINGEEFIKTLKLAYQNDFTYTLVMTDYAMSRMDGIEATKAMRAFLSDEMNLHRER